MYFNIVLPVTQNALGVDITMELFPSAHTEITHAETREVEVKVTYTHPAERDNWELPEKVAFALYKAWPDQLDAIMRDIRRSGIGSDVYYGFNRWGMFVGVEPDGYIHT